MLSLRLEDVARATGGRRVGPDVAIDSVSTDTRAIAPGALFVALRGERHDAHDFVPAARDAGAAAALVARELPLDLPQVVVDDTQVALGALARAVRARRDVRVAGITGSNGKTTVKTLLAAILSRHAPTHVNAGNFNNEIGLPLTVLAMPASVEFVVLEMGAGQPGDIAWLAGIGQPRVALVNNVAPAHLERMGSLEGVAETKGAIYTALPADGTAVINADDAFAGYFSGLAAPRRVLRFGLAATTVDVGARDVEADANGSRFVLVTPAGEAAVTLALPGRHNVLNALAAATLAVALEVPLATIVAGLESADPVAGRSTRHRLANGARLVDDSYNANPGSFAAAIAVLAAEAGTRILVMGDMRELGADAERLHADTGALAREAGIDRLLAVGALSAAAVRGFGDGATHFSDQAALVEALRASLPADAVVLVKGSRGSAMDRVVRALLGTSDASGGRHAA